MPLPCPHCSAPNRDTAQFCARCSQPLRQICDRCGAGSPPRSRFCNKCGAPLTQWVHCPQCGRVNPTGSLFCNGCGTALAPAGGQPQPPAPARPPARVGTGRLPPQTLLIERYVILKRVGRGGMGAVYQAADARISGKMWAVKEMSDAAIIDPGEKRLALDAFRQEAVMLATLDHPNLPKVTDHFSEGGRQYLVMDFIEGETLEDRLDREGGKPLPVDEVLGWAGQLCDVLDYLHRRNPPVVFRDLKPSNVMVTPEGAVKLIDFGIARLFKPGKASDTGYFGTAGYAPKEQYGKGQTDARSDVYALGATLYHLLTGDDPVDHPFAFGNVLQLNRRVPAHVADAVVKALADDPVDRWQSVAEMRKGLGEAPLPHPQPVPHPVPKTQPRVSAAPKPAPAAARAAAVAQPVAMPAASNLNFWSGVGLVVLGAVLFGVGGLLLYRPYYDYFFGLGSYLPLAFIPPLFGVLFGPWVGLGTGFAGWLLFLMIMLGGEIRYFDSTAFLAIAGLASSGGVMGMLPAWMVNDARKWLSTALAGCAASLAWATIIPVGLGVVAGYWDEFSGLWLYFLMLVLPANVVLLPFFARWLVEGSDERWKVVAWGLLATLLWAGAAGVGTGLMYGEMAAYWELVWDAIQAILPVSVVLVPLVAWLSGAVRRWGLYWRDFH